jgi:hypothetical protein
MNEEPGYTVIELLVATAVLLVAASGVFGLLDIGVARTSVWNESADLHQRGRLTSEILSSILGNAGAGPGTGPLLKSFAPIEPKRRTTGIVSDSAITVRYVPDGALHSTLAAPLIPGATSVAVVRHSGCADGTTACGFVTGMDVVIFDAAGNWDTAVVQSIAPDTLEIADRAASRSATYDTGTHIAEIAETTLYLNASDDTLRREHPGVSNLPLVDNVVALQFEYFGDPFPPTAPRPPAGTANCVYDAAGNPAALPTLVADHGALATLTLPMLADGPFCGSGANAYDVDLLRVRKVRITLTLQTGVSLLRGTDSAFFTRPGAARSANRMLPDLHLSVAMTPPNLQR